MLIESNYLKSIINKEAISTESNFGTPISAENEGFYMGKMQALAHVLEAIESMERKFIPAESVISIIKSMEGLTEEQRDIIKGAIEEEQV